MTAIGELRERDWADAIRADGKVDPDAQVLDVTAILSLSPGRDRMEAWPADQRAIALRIPRPVGDQDKLGQDPSWRYGEFTTNADGQLKWLDARHRTPGSRRGQAEKTSRLARLRICRPTNWVRNSAWLRLDALATSLKAWLRHISPDGDLARNRNRKHCDGLFGGTSARHTHPCPQGD